MSVPECTIDDLRGADAVIFGSPTRYGNMSAQMKALIDSTVQLWLTGAMEEKPKVSCSRQPMILRLHGRSAGG
jgi:NAD(P)H dehydrogenase (quinone)